jgi:hypothetical protein
LFFHGVGGRGIWQGTLRTKHDNNYWNVPGQSMSKGVAKYCNHYGVFDTDTFNRGYDDETLIADVCNAIGNYEGNTQRAVIFTHSMGGLYTRKAFHQEGCGWKGKYYQSQPPMDGSRAAGLPAFVCPQIAHHTRGLLYISALAAYCGPDASGAYGLGYDSIIRGRPSYSWAGYNSSTGRNKRSDGRLCGVTPKGFKRGPWRALVTIQALSNMQRKNVCKGWNYTWYGQKFYQMYKANNYNFLCTRGWKYEPWNDGMVAANSCIGHNAVGNAPIFYTSMNHADGTGREGTVTAVHNDIYRWFNRKTLKL